MGLQYLPNDLQMLYCLGTTYSNGKRQNDAKRIFNEGLRLLNATIEKNPNVADNEAWRGLYLSRLGRKSESIGSFTRAVKLDSTDEDIIMKVTRGYAVLGMKNEMLNWFRRAKAMNPEYDAAYLRTALDFEKYRNDTDLLILARQ
jgi:tetratricopeptide (TPR) repeat protein